MKKYYKRLRYYGTQARGYLGYSSVKINNGQADYKNIFYFHSVRVNTRRVVYTTRGIYISPASVLKKDSRVFL